MEISLTLELQPTSRGTRSNGKRRATLSINHSSWSSRRPIDFTFCLRYASPPQIEATGRQSDSRGAGKGSRISKGFQDARCYLIRHRSLPWFCTPRFRRNVQQWRYCFGGGHRLGNGVRRSQNGRGNRQGILRYVSSTQSSGRRHVHLDKELRRECVPFAN